MSESVAGVFSIQKTLYTVLDFLNWQRDGALNLRPYFQRGSVWTPKAKSYLIDTLIRGYPLPVIYIQNQTDRTSFKNVRQVIDGQQRLRTVLAYMDIACLPDADDTDVIKVLRTHNKEYAGRAFNVLPPDVRERIANTELSVHVLPSVVEDREILEMFARLNSTGEKLNAQELRNARFHGPFKTTAYELSYEQIERWTEWRVFTPRALAQMQDVEFTSELMMLLMDGLSSKSAPAIDHTYLAFDDEFPFADEVEARFRNVMRLLGEVLSSPETTKLQNQSWIYAITAVMQDAVYGGPLGSKAPRKPASVSLPNWRRSLEKAQIRIDTGDLPEDVSKALRGASTDRGSREARIGFLRSVIG